MISILYYGVGNIGSTLNMLKYLNTDAKIIKTAEEVEKSEKIILPGVGSFDAAMKTIRKNNLDEALNLVAKRGAPLLGICLGMQLLTKSSEEGNFDGLCLIDAEVKNFKHKASSEFRVPHMGWNVINPQKKSPLLSNFNKKEEIRFYFAHSYYAKCSHKENVLATTPYGLNFDSIIGKDNIFGVQFHPEKSHCFGMKIFDNFAKI